jgi:hypothetical protein
MMNSAEGVVQRGVVELGRPAASKVPAGTIEVVPVRALLLGERLDTRALERDKPLGIAPLTVEIPGGGIAVLFRYGAIVLFGMATAMMDSFVASLKPLIAGVFPIPERDEARLLVRPDIDQQVDPSGNIILNEKTTDRLQLVADGFCGSTRSSRGSTCGWPTNTSCVTATALDRKLDVVCRTVETLLGLVQTRSSLRVEWYIVLLIIAEILLTTYPLFLHR